MTYNMFGGTLNLTLSIHLLSVNSKISTIPFKCHECKRQDEGISSWPSLRLKFQLYLNDTHYAFCLWLCVAVGEHAGVVRCCLSCQRQKWCHNVSIVRSRDTARDRHQQSAASTETAACHPGNGQLDQSVCSTNCPHGEYVVCPLYVNSTQLYCDILAAEQLDC